MRRMILMMVWMGLGTAIFADSIPLFNGGFESGNLAGWTRIGDAMVVDSSFGTPPASGSYHALITDAPGYLDFCCPGGQFTGYSGFPSLRAEPVPGIPLLDTALGLPAGAILDFMRQRYSSHFFIFEGSAIQTTLTTANALDGVQFDYNFLSNETFLSVSPFIEDLAFYVLDGQIGIIDGFNPRPNDFLSATPFWTESGYRSFGITIPTAGTHTLAVGVIDVEDSAYNTGILVDNFRTTAVPEPSTWILCLSGIAGIFYIKKRRG